VAAFGQQVDSDKYHGGAQPPVVLGGRNARFRIVHPAHDERRRHVHTQSHGVLKRHWVALKNCSAVTMWRKISRQAAGFILADIGREEMLTVQVGVFHDIMVEDAKAADSFAAQTFTDLTADPAGTDRDAVRHREACLIKSGDQFLAMSNRKTPVGRHHLFSGNFNV